MEFSQVTEALASKSFDNIADICDNLMLKVAAEGVAFEGEWPYAIHLLAHIYVNDINSARFLWKSIPVAIKENQPEVVAAWNIGQKLWTRDYAGVYEAICGFDWSPEVKVIAAAFAGEALQKEDVSASAVCLFNCKHPMYGSLPGNERGGWDKLCGTARLGFGSCFPNVNSEEAACLVGAKTGSWQTTALDRIRFPP
ncbi:hypothetical protein ACFE04_022395 [Oxalis oulophora]